MGRLIRMPARRSTFYAFEETIASLHEELQLTLNYAHAMVRDKNYRAAAEVIEEQRRSLARATKRMEKALTPEAPVRRQARVRAALVGVAAAMALASGAFAAFGPSSSKPTAPGSRIEAIQQASEAYTAATTISDPVALQQIVGDANQKILDIANSNPTDLLVQRSLIESVRRLQTVLKTNPNVPASVREQAKQVAEHVQDVVEAADETTTETKTETETNTQSSAPAAEPSV
jgi:hypothetical protein